TAIIAGFLIAALSGSRVQIGGPTGAFVVIVYAIVQEFGYDGLAVATLMAGVMLVAMGLARFGAVIKYIPYPVTVGFTAGIALIIAVAQVKDLLGLAMAAPPADFVEKIGAYAAAVGSVNPHAIWIGLGTIALLVYWPRVTRRVPGSIVALLLTPLVVQAFNFPVETIGSQFGSVASTLPRPRLPHITWELVTTMFSPAVTIALLAGVESLLSAVVADGMTGRRHRSNTELVAQGMANVTSSLFGGLPATGAIARTATNIRAGARTPFAGMFHAGFVLVFVLVLAPTMTYIPLAALAAVLLVVAWNISEFESFRHTMSAPKGDRLVLLSTFGLTVFFDLTFAIQVGLVLAAFVFMARMAEAVEITDFGDDGREVPADADQRSRLPPGVEAFQISGPLFFGAASRLDEVLDLYRETPRAFILRMRLVPVVDASGVHAFRALWRRCRARGIVLIVSGLQAQPTRVFKQMGLHRENGSLYFAANF